MHLPPLLYDCVSCGKSCTDFQVEIQAKDLDRVRESAATKALERAGFTPLQLVGNQVFLEKIQGSRCRYLDDETLCLLHKEGGLAHKPRTCQDFPFVPVSTPDGVYLGVSFYCTAVAQSLGRPLTGREAEFERFSQIPALEPNSQWSLWGETAVDWAGYLRIEHFCRTALLEGGLPSIASAAWRLGQTVLSGDSSYLSETTKGPGALESLLDIAKRIIPLMESTDDAISQSVAEAIRGQQEFASAALGEKVLLQAPPPHDPDWFSGEMARYLEHVLFRKSLLSAPNVLSQVCLLGLAGQLVRIYSYTRAALNRRDLEREDFWKAVGIVEGRLMVHANGLEPAILDGAQRFLGATSGGAL